MDMAAIAAAQASVKALFGITQAVTAATVDHQLKQKLIDIQSSILDAQQQLADAQAERLSLLEEVQELRNKLRAFENAKAALDSYELHEVEAGKFLYKSKSDGCHHVEHFACPTCHNAGKVTVLQSVPTGKQRRLYGCGACKFQLSVGPSDPPAEGQRFVAKARMNW